MLRWFSPSPPPLSNYGFLGVDMHSHLLPGIDDGAQTLEDSLSLIRQLKDMGYRHLITTPHVMADLYPNTPEIILGKLAETRAALAEAQLDITIDAAAEYLMDEAFGEKIAQGNLLCLPGKRVLVEMSFIAPPPELDTYLFQLQTKGYRPVLAHPERYLFYSRTKERYVDLKNRGCEFQLNLLSLSGYYGKGVQDLAKYLLKEKMVNFIGTDLHHQKHASLISSLLQQKKINRLLAGYTDLTNNRNLFT